MEIIQRICSCLEMKKEMFTKYEQQTEAMQQCELEQLSHYITNRAELAIEIDKIDDEISAMCQLSPDRELLGEVVKNACDFSSVPQELQCVYKKGQEIFAVINRIAESEAQLQERFAAMREDLLAHIRELQNFPKIKTYLSGLTDGPQKGAYLGKRYDKI